MIREDKLEILAKAAGYSLIPPQEIFTVSAETSIQIDEEPNVEKASSFFHSKVKKWFLTSRSDAKIPTMRRHLISWIQNHVHV